MIEMRKMKRFSDRLTKPLSIYYLHIPWRFISLGLSSGAYTQITFTSSSWQIFMWSQTNDALIAFACICPFYLRSLPALALPHPEINAILIKIIKHKISCAAIEPLSNRIVLFFIPVLNKSLNLPYAEASKSKHGKYWTENIWQK